MLRQRISRYIGLIAALLLSLAPARAGAEAETEPNRGFQRDIWRLANSIYANARNPNISEGELEKVRWHMTRALAILERQDPGVITSTAGPYDFDACVAIAHEAYAQAHVPMVARRRALERCKGWRLLDVTRLLFRAYSGSYAPPTAMDLALDRASDEKLRGKSALLDYAIANYEKSYAASTAVDRAVQEVAQIRADGLECVRRANRSYARKDPAFTALDKAFAACRDRYEER